MALVQKKPAAPDPFLITLADAYIDVISAHAIQASAERELIEAIAARLRGVVRAIADEAKPAAK